jgi:hypothetical protein
MESSNEQQIKKQVASAINNSASKKIISNQIHATSDKSNRIPTKLNSTPSTVAKRTTNLAISAVNGVSASAQQVVSSAPGAVNSTNKISGAKVNSKIAQSETKTTNHSSQQQFSSLLQQANTALSSAPESNTTTSMTNNSMLSIQTKSDSVKKSPTNSNQLAGSDSSIKNKKLSGISTKINVNTKSTKNNESSLPSTTTNISSSISVGCTAASGSGSSNKLGI